MDVEDLAGLTPDLPPWLWLAGAVVAATPKILDRVPPIIREINRFALVRILRTSAKADPKHAAKQVADVLIEHERRGADVDSTD